MNRGNRILWEAVKKDKKLRNHMHIFSLYSKGREYIIK